MIPILPNENRAVLQSLEQSESLPQGLLQGLNEKKTGWRPNLNFLPDYMLPESDRGENKTEQEVMAQNLAGAKLLRANLDMFGGNESLASHAFNFGAENTQKRLKEGKFPQDEVDTIFDIAKRKAGILGKEITSDDIDRFSNMLGAKPSNKVIKQKQPPRPEPQKPVSLKRSEEGAYYTGNPLYDSLLEVEGSESQSDVESKFLQLKRQVRNNEKALKKAGVPVDETTLYLAQRKGIKTAIKAWNEKLQDEQQIVKPVEVMPDISQQPTPESNYKEVVTNKDWGEIADKIFSKNKPSYTSKTVSKAITGLLTGIAG